MRLHHRHHAEFMRLGPPASWTGGIPASWAAALIDYEGGPLPTSTINRADLRAFCRSPDTTPEACFVACMAWGMMRGKNRRLSWEQRHLWVPIVERLREGGVSREAAYALFHEADIPGLRTAFFTKLIFFLRPDPDGYILDQWTAKSVSLVLVPQFITINRYGWVTPANDANIYRRYCEIVEHLAQVAVEDATIIEDKMFAGGRKVQPWRQYVREHWRR